MRKLVKTFIQVANAFDVERVIVLFTSDAVIEDVSVGDAFVGTEGVRRYIEQFYVGYKTSSKLLLFQQMDNCNAVIRLDFTGEFGHEIGTLEIKINPDGLIERIVADLE